ncbi:hypothetical protein A2U01_0051181, partial [Trifolium medium]|nr:hypothetical protein [Trifolium medium]
MQRTEFEPWSGQSLAARSEGEGMGSDLK